MTELSAVQGNICKVKDCLGKMAPSYLRILDPPIPPPLKIVRNSKLYYNLLREVRLGGWGSEGPKGPTLGQYVSVCATILLGSGRI